MKPTPEMSANCKGCGQPVTAEEVERWDGFCEACLELGRNFDAEETAPTAGPKSLRS
jgi:hypothetical protein